MKKWIILLLSVPVIALGINTANKQIKASKEIEIRPSSRVDIYADTVVKNENELRLEDAAGGEYVSLKSPATLAGNVDFTLPVDDGLVDQLLRTDGAGILSWVDGFTFSASNDNRLLRSDTIDGDQIQESGVTLDDTDFLSGLTRLAVDNIDIDGTTIKNNTTTLLTILSGSAGNLDLNPNGNDVRVLGGLDVVTTTDASHPCPTMDNTARDLLTAVAGDCIYSSTDTELQQYDGASWNPIGTGTGGGATNLLTDGGFDSNKGGTTGELGLTCSIGTCSLEETNQLHSDGALKIALTAQAASVSKCYDNSVSHQWDNKMIELSAWIKSSEASVEICYFDGTTEGNCVAYDGSDEWRKIRIIESVQTDNSLCVKIKSASATDDIFVDVANIFAFSPTGTTRVESLATHWDGGLSAMTTLTGTLKFGAGMPDTLHLDYEESTGELTALKDITVNFSSNIYSNTPSNGFLLKKNGVNIAQSNHTPSGDTDWIAVMSAGFLMKTGDNITIHATGTASNFIPNAVNILTEHYEQASVLAEAAPTGLAAENVFTARISSAGAILSQSPPGWISTASGPSPAGTYQITPVTNLFSVTPSVECTVNVPSAGGRDGACWPFTLSASQMFFFTARTADLAARSDNFDVVVVKQGVDYVEPSKEIVATFKPAVNASIVKGTTNQDITGGATANFESAEYDPDGNFDLVNDWYLVPEEGCYLFTGNATMDSSTTGNYRSAHFSVGGNQFGRVFYTPTSFNGSAGPSLNPTAVRCLSKGDQVTMVLDPHTASIGAFADGTANYYRYMAVQKVDQAGVINDLASDDEYIKVKPAGDQLITSTAVTQLTLDSIEKSNCCSVASNQITVDKPGTYMVCYNISGYNYGDAYVETTLDISGINKAEFFGLMSSPTSEYTSGKCSPVELSAGNTVEIFSRSVADTSYNISGNRTFLSLKRINRQ